MESTEGGKGEDARISTTEQVYQAILDCREFGIAATRQSITEMTNLPTVIVDDRIKFLKTMQRIRLAGGKTAGVFEPTEDRREDRPVFAGIMASGRVKVEFDNQVWDMNQREGRNLAALLAGLMFQFRGQ